MHRTCTEPRAPCREPTGRRQERMPMHARPKNPTHARILYAHMGDDHEEREKKGQKGLTEREKV